MGYPGDHDRSGGHFPEPHGQEPAGDGRPGQDDSPSSPFDPPPGAFAARPGESFGTDDRSDDPYGQDEGGFGTGGFRLSGPGPAAGGFDAPGPAAGGFGLDASGPAAGGFDAPGAGPAAGGRFASGGGEHGPFGPVPREDERFGPAADDGFGQGSGGRFAAGSFEQQGSPAFGAPGGHEPGPGSFDGPGDELYGAAGERYFEQGAEPTGPAAHAAPPEDAEPAKRGRSPLLVAGAVVAGLLLVGAGFTVSTMLTGDDSADGATAAGTRSATPRPTPTPTPSVTAGPLNAKLKSRTTDPDPLSLEEVFGARSFTQKGQKYVRTAWKQDRSCAKTVNGDKLETALKKGGCVQVLRATFARGDGKLIGTVGVLNLKSESAARTAEKAGAGRDAYLQPLAGSGVTKKIGKGAALGTTFVRGHYLIMTWVQRPDGKTITSKYHKTVSTFQQQIILGSNLSKALHYRGIEGKPLTG